jgi:hypothetical protein
MSPVFVNSQKSPPAAFELISVITSLGAAVAVAIARMAKPHVVRRVKTEV